MTREEAANVLWWVSKQHYPGDQMDITEYVIEAFDVAIVALRESCPGKNHRLTRLYYFV